MAMAVQELFPGAQVTTGPVIENGFYYDFKYERPFTSEDLARIENRMEELAKQDLPASRSAMSREDAVKLFEKMGEEYKVRIIEDIPGEEDLSFYSQGDFIDLCRGPHVPSTRSEERRVGKECRSRWSAYRENRKGRCGGG